MAMDKEAFSKKFGTHLKKIREDKGLSLNELGLQGDFDRQALWKLEKGQKHLTVYSLYKICDSLGITLEEFFKGFNKKS
jgi:transcriptional regulator with XRE-family HTH domain